MLAIYCQINYRARGEELTRRRRVVVAQFGVLALLGGDVDDVAVAAAGAGAVEGLGGHAAAVVRLIVCRRWLAGSSSDRLLVAGRNVYW